MTQNEIDQVGMDLAATITRQAQCKSRQIGAVIMFGNRVVGTGVNGAVALPPCDPCHREGLPSGSNLNLCPAIHAEVSAIAHAARYGQQTKGTTMYVTCGVPCKDCLVAITVAGISRIVCMDNTDYYDTLSRQMVAQSSVLKVDTYHKSRANIFELPEVK